ncbi:MAG: RagB/SusD family nutrient uptake outer membrane protein [Chitinophagaceae bacterium]
MKILSNITGIVLISMMAVAPGCKKILEEQNRSNILPDYFSTPGGVDAAVIGSYSNIRNWYCQEGMCFNTMIGTDEHISGFGTTGNFHTYTVQPGDGAIQSIWDWSYRSINNCNAVLEFGPQAGVSAAELKKLTGEAKFLRAYFYFMLVTTFGDVSISTTFATNPTTEAKREPIAAVYDLIIKDLTEAIVDLPLKASPTPGRAAQGLAKHLLAKVYLTRGWSSAAKPTDFTTAYDSALSLINSKGLYGNGAGTLDLWQDFADVFKEGNEYGKEILWVVDRNTDPKGAETTGFGTGNPGGKFNGSLFYQRPNYPVFNTDINAGITGAPEVKANPVDRDILNGRPFGRVRPTDYVLSTAFAERVNDSRYEKTFQTFWIFNRPGPLTSGAPVTIKVTRAANVNDPLGPTAEYTWVKGVDTAIKLWGTNTITEADRRVSKAVLVLPNQYDLNFFPPMKKHDDVTKLHTNDASDRPFILMRFAETYLLAAEAAFKAGNNANAAAMINVLRSRAAYRTTNDAAQNAAAAAANQITAGDITLDFILNERTRELFGEWMRWYDLVRTKSLGARLAAYNPIANFKPEFALRPIPQSQINLVTTGPIYPQNPGY